MTSEEFNQIVRDWIATAKHPVTKRLYTEIAPTRPPAGSAPVAQLSFFAEEANLARINDAKNMRRFYRMEVWPDLLGGALLMPQWGRIGTEGR